MRTVGASVATMLASEHVSMCLLIEADLTTPLYLATLGEDITYNAKTYIGIGGAGQIGVIEESAQELKPISFTLSAVPSTRISLALSEYVQGDAVRIYTMFFNPSTYAVLETRLRWQGRIDTMHIEEDGDNPRHSKLIVTAESAAIDLLRPSGRMFSDADQQLVSAGDTFFKYTAQQAEKPIVWPAASFYRK